MSTTQTSVRFSDATREKLEFLAARYNSQTEALAVAVDRLYQAESKGENVMEKMVKLTRQEQATVPVGADANVILWHGGCWVYADFDGESAVPVQDDDQGGDYVPVDVGDLIAGRLTDEDVEAWHAGELTDNANALVGLFGAFQVWGSRQGPEPLTVKVM